MTVVDDQRENNYFKLKFVEMFEFLARLALHATLLEYKDQDEEEESTQNLPTNTKRMKLYYRGNME